MGLGSAAFFLLLVFYIIFKVHCYKRREIKAVDSKIEHQQLEEGMSTPRSISLNSLWSSRCSHQESVDISGASTVNYTAEQTSKHSRLTAAKFNSMQQNLWFDSVTLVDCLDWINRYWSNGPTDGRVSYFYFNHHTSAAVHRQRYGYRFQYETGRCNNWIASDRHTNGTTTSSSEFWEDLYAVPI